MQRRFQREDSHRADGSNRTRAEAVITDLCMLIYVYIVYVNGSIYIYIYIYMTCICKYVARQYG